MNSRLASSSSSSARIAAPADRTGARSRRARDRPRPPAPGPRRAREIGKARTGTTPSCTCRRQVRATSRPKRVAAQGGMGGGPIGSSPSVAFTPASSPRWPGTATPPMAASSARSRRRPPSSEVSSARALRLVQAVVGALARHQFVVRCPTSTTCPRSMHDQPVGLAQRRQPVGDGDRGAALHQVVERLLDLLLGLGVDRRGGLVEDQDARVDQQRARDRDALALAAGQRLAALADQRVVAVRQAQDEVVRMRGARRRDDLRRGWRRACRRRCSRRWCRRTGTAPAARARCGAGSRRRAATGCRRRRPGSRRRTRRRSGRSG